MKEQSNNTSSSTSSSSTTSSTGPQSQVFPDVPETAALDAEEFKKFLKRARELPPYQSEAERKTQAITALYNDIFKDPNSACLRDTDPSYPNIVQFTNASGALLVTQTLKDGQLSFKAEPTFTGVISVPRVGEPGEKMQAYDLIFYEKGKLSKILMSSRDETILPPSRVEDFYRANRTYTDKYMDTKESVMDAPGRFARGTASFVSSLLPTSRPTSQDRER